MQHRGDLFCYLSDLRTRSLELINLIFAFLANIQNLGIGGYRKSLKTFSFAFRGSNSGCLAFLQSYWAAEIRNRHGPSKWCLFVECEPAFLDDHPILLLFFEKTDVG